MTSSFALSDPRLDDLNDVILKDSLSDDESDLEIVESSEEDRDLIEERNGEERSEAARAKTKKTR